MAEQSKPFFNIDAKKILATLHLAGQSQVMIEDGKQLVINTAIINPVEKGDPSNIGNTEFDLSKDEYQVATGHQMQFKLPIILKLNADLAKKYDEFKKLDEDSQKKQKNESIKVISFSNFLLMEANDKNNKGLLDKDTDETHDEQSDSNIIAEKTNDKLYKKANELIQIYNEYASFCDKSKKFKDLMKMIKENTKDVDIKDKDGKEIKSKAISNFKQIDKLFQESIQEENDLNKEEYDKILQETINKNVKNLKTYFSSFSGKESANAINENNIVLKPGDTDGNFSPVKFENIKDFKIDFETIEQQCKEFDEKYQTDVLKNKNATIKRTMLCIVGYKINKDTM